MKAYLDKDFICDRDRNVSLSVCPLAQKVHEAGAKIGVQLLHSIRWPDKGPGSAEVESALMPVTLT